MDRFDGETAELRLTIEKFENRTKSKFVNLGSDEETDAAINAFFTDKRKVTNLVTFAQGGAALGLSQILLTSPPTVTSVKVTPQLQ